MASRARDPALRHRRYGSGIHRRRRARKRPAAGPQCGERQWGRTGAAPAIVRRSSTSSGAAGGRRAGQTRALGLHVVVGVRGSSSGSGGCSRGGTTAADGRGDRQVVIRHRTQALWSHVHLLTTRLESWPPRRWERLSRDEGAVREDAPQDLRSALLAQPRLSLRRSGRRVAASITPRICGGGRHDWGRSRSGDPRRAAFREGGRPSTPPILRRAARQCQHCSEDGSPHEHRAEQIDTLVAVRTQAHAAGGQRSPSNRAAGHGDRRRSSPTARGGLRRSGARTCRSRLASTGRNSRLPPRGPRSLS